MTRGGREAGPESACPGSSVSWVLPTVGAFVSVSSGGGPVCWRGGVRVRRTALRCGLAVALALPACIFARGRPLCLGPAYSRGPLSPDTGGTSRGPPRMGRGGREGRAAVSQGEAELSEQPCSQLHPPVQLCLSFRARGAAPPPEGPRPVPRGTHPASAGALGCFLLLVRVPSPRGGVGERPCGP